MVFNDYDFSAVAARSVVLNQMGRWLWNLSNKIWVEAAVILLKLSPNSPEGNEKIFENPQKR